MSEKTIVPIEQECGNNDKAVVSLNVGHASPLGTDVSFQFGTNPTEVPP